MPFKACNLQNNVLQVAKVVGVGSSLKALKNKGEEHGSETFSRRLWCRHGIEKVSYYFSCFWRTKSSSVGRIDPGGSRETHRTKMAQKSKCLDYARKKFMLSISSSWSRRCKRLIKPSSYAKDRALKSLIWHGKIGAHSVPHGIPVSRWDPHGSPSSIDTWHFFHWPPKTA